MEEVDVLPEVQEIVGAILFAAKEPVTTKRLLEVFRVTAESAAAGPARELGAVTREDLESAIQALARDLERRGLGLRVVPVAGGYRMENDTRCGPWLRAFLEKGKPNRLSKPALETLAIIAYRQPVVRSEIEAVRGVSVDQIVRNLLDLQLIRAMGRSDFPGRPWLFGTTQRFLEHFGLRSLDDLPGVEELRRREAERKSAPALESSEPEEAEAHDSPSGAADGPESDVSPEEAEETPFNPSPST